MRKSVQNVKNSLKFKVSPRVGILSVKVGVKKYALPVEARMLSSDSYLFLSFSASSELYTISGKELLPMATDSDGTDAFHALNPGKKRGRRRRDPLQMPAELEAALKSLPAGFKLGYTAEGNPKLVRVRSRKKAKG